MKYWLLGAIVFSGGAAAVEGLYQLLSKQDTIEPLVMMEKVEAEHPGYIAKFDTELDEGQFHYQFEVIDPEQQTFTKLSYRATDGALILQRQRKLEADAQDKLEAGKWLAQQGMEFSTLTRLATERYPARLLEAHLEHDLDISYLEFRLIDTNGKRKYAFDIQKLKPLPMLQWER